MRTGILAVAAYVVTLAACAHADPVDLKTLKLPPGFSIDVYASDVPNARELALGTNGTVFAGSREAGKVYALVDADHDHRADTDGQLRPAITVADACGARRRSMKRVCHFHSQAAPLLDASASCRFWYPICHPASVSGFKTSPVRKCRRHNSSAFHGAISQKRKGPGSRGQV